MASSNDRDLAETAALMATLNCSRPLHHSIQSPVSAGGKALPWDSQGVVSSAASSASRSGAQQENPDGMPMAAGQGGDAVSVVMTRSSVAMRAARLGRSRSLLEPSKTEHQWAAWLIARQARAFLQRNPGDAGGFANRGRSAVSLSERWESLCKRGLPAQASRRAGIWPHWSVGWETRSSWRKQVPGRPPGRRPARELSRQWFRIRPGGSLATFQIEFWVELRRPGSEQRSFHQPSAHRGKRLHQAECRFLYLQNHMAAASRDHGGVAAELDGVA